MAGKAERGDRRFAGRDSFELVASHTPRRRTSTPAFPLKRLKYRNKWTEYGGVKYASKREAKYAAELDLLVRAKEITSWRRQVRVPLIVGGRKITTYVLDFEIKHLSGEFEYIEVKGWPTPEWILKWKLFDALWPNLRKRVVK